jgi:uncharacterized protein YggU (UPF0235/DUF167 family)
MNNSETHYITIFVKAITNSSTNKLSELTVADDGSISIEGHLTASPSRGKANESLIKLLSKTLKIKQADIKILRGHTNNKKILALYGINYDRLLLNNQIS